VKIGPAVPEICSRTDRQLDVYTDRQRIDRQTYKLIAILRSSIGTE